MKQLVKLSLVAALVFTFGSCEKNNLDDYPERPVTYKTGDNENDEPPILEGRIVDDQTQEGLFRIIVVLNRFSPDNPALDSTYTDSSGYFRFELETSGDYYLDFYENSEVIITTDKILVDDSTYITVYY